MAEKNPFLVLGFSPSAFDGLLDPDIRALVRAQYRVLVALHHPDRKGDPERFKVIQEAMDKLEADFEFAEWKKKFLRPNKRLEELQRELIDARKAVNLSRGALAHFWEAYCKGRQLVYGKSKFALGMRFKDRKQLYAFSVFRPPSVSLTLEDVLEGKMAIRAIANRRPPPPSGPARLRPPPRPLPFLTSVACSQFELCIGKSGEVTIQELARIPSEGVSEHELPSREEWIMRAVPAESQGYFLKPQGEAQVLQGKILGSLPESCVTGGRADEDSPKVEGLIPAQVRTEDFQVAKDGYPLHDFERLLPFLKPMIVSRHHVVVANTQPELRFKVLGCVRHIRELRHN